MFTSSKKRNLFLTGMMATGKSAIGEIVARKLAYVFIDTDAVIERQLALTVTDIFAVHGEEFFRAREAALLPEISGREHQVIATGGGMLVDPDNLTVARANGLLVLLHAPVGVLVNRLGAASERPLLDGYVPAERLQEIYQQRAKFYEAIQRRVDTSDGDLNKAAERVVNLYSEWLSE